MNAELDTALESLTPIQMEAASWTEGSVLVLAGPGAGKTRVLTTRIAKLLHMSEKQKFRILALTFTTKAAAEMRERVETLVPGAAEERTFIGTFHAFCTQLLRQHGSHIGIRPDFGIYGQKEDQEGMLKDAIQKAIGEGKDFSVDDIRWLETIKTMKAQLITPQKASLRIRDPRMQRVYELYEDTLRLENIMDFEGLILESCRLLAKTPAVAARIRQSYKYWMVDEFQDTTPAQYWLLHYLAGSEFKNVFAVADDDQIIYQWAGASYRQIEKFRADYQPALIQLLENHRCPPEIVGIANRLVAYNTQRAPEKQPTTASRKEPLHAMTFRTYGTDSEEAETLAEEIASLAEQGWGQIAILGRTRALLQPILECLKKRNVRAILAQRRDNFISPQFVWLESCLGQALRPTNKHVFGTLVNSGNRIINADLDPGLLIAEAEATGQSYMEYWGVVIEEIGGDVAGKLGSIAKQLSVTRNNWKEFIKTAIPVLLASAIVGDGAVSDTQDDHRAWESCIREIRSELGSNPDLPDIVQGFALRSKEPPKTPNTVTLLTVHSSKGLEFDVVYLVGLAEGEMPSWQSCKKGPNSAEMEEERRNCFVAITRTRERLTLSTASNYRGWKKDPSRFLREMSVLS